GGNRESGAIWRWDGNKYNVQNILPLPGYTGVTFSGISNNEVAVGYMWIDLIVNRTPVIYTKNTGLMNLTTFLWELYGINAMEYDLFTPMGISLDGRKIIGWGSQSNEYFSYYIELGDQPINTRPLRVTARQVRNTLNIKLNWAKPYNNGKVILGYNVYRDNQKVNTDLITDTTYIHQNIVPGIGEYAVTTVFTDKEESKKSESVKLEIAEAGGCYSVKRFENEIIYNKTILLDWGLPSAEIISNENAIHQGSMMNRQLPYNQMDQSVNSPFYELMHVSDTRLGANTKASVQRIPNNSNQVSTTIAPSTYQNHTFDYISSIDLKSNSKISLFKWNDYYYVGDYNTKYINRLDLKGNLVNTFSIPNLPSAKSFTTDGKNVYVACGNRFIYKVDLEKQELIDQIRVDSLTQRICYIPELDNNKGGFEVGGWFTSTFITMDGKDIGEGFAFENVYATTYYKGKVYASQQTGKNYIEIHEYNVSDKKPTGVKFDPSNLSVIKKNASTYGAIAGGISLVVMEDSTVALCLVAQITYKTNRALFLELESMPGLLGFNLYKNGQKVNTEPLKKRSYADIVTIPGKYEYFVTSLIGDCESAASRKDTLEIFPLGSCGKVQHLRGEEINKEVFIKWEAPNKSESAATLLGFNIYRDNQKLNDDFSIYMQYRDKKARGSAPVYRIESFYDNSCSASDTVRVAITGNGQCDYVHLLQINPMESATQKGAYNVSLKWDLPYYEAMYPLTWGNDAAYNVVGLENNIPFTVAIGFDQMQLADFRDFKVVGMDFFLGDLAVVDPIVLIDEKIVYNEPGDKVKEHSYNRFMFHRAIPLDSMKAELVVGYSVSNYTGLPAGVDYSEIVHGYGNLISTDPVNPGSWKTAGSPGNWAISILLAKDRTISTATASTSAAQPNFDGQGILEMVRLNQSVKAVRSQALTTHYLNENEIRLLGFNVYRDDVKLNPEPLKTTQYLDESNLTVGNYVYKVGSLWSKCEEMMSEGKMARVTANEEMQTSQIVQIYPNPVQDKLNIQGAYDKADIMDLSGKVLESHSNYSPTLSVSHLTSGVYLLRVSAKDKIQHIRFVVK
ncbi:MAG: T9SS type A sorting domain-containing protein, partial [Bacteroidales bacterium]